MCSYWYDINAEFSVLIANVENFNHVKMVHECE